MAVYVITFLVGLVLGVVLMLLGKFVPSPYLEIVLITYVSYTIFKLVTGRKKTTEKLKAIREKRNVDVKILAYLLSGFLAIFAVGMIVPNVIVFNQKIFLFSSFYMLILSTYLTFRLLSINK